MSDIELPFRAATNEACAWLAQQTGFPWTLARLLENGLRRLFLVTSFNPPQAMDADSSTDTYREMWTIRTFASTARHVSAAKREAANRRTLNSPLSWQFG